MALRKPRVFKLAFSIGISFLINEAHAAPAAISGNPTPDTRPLISLGRYLPFKSAGVGNSESMALSNSANRLLGPYLTFGEWNMELHPLGLREITDTPHVPATFRLRYLVWHSETLLRPHVVEAGVITDEHDAHARHWAVFRGDEIVAAARMCIHAHQADTPDAPAFLHETLVRPVATLNRLIVHPSVRKHGLSSALDDARISAARQDGARCVVGTFPAIRIKPLENLGFRLTGQQWTPNHAETFVAHAMVLEL